MRKLLVGIALAMLGVVLAGTLVAAAPAKPPPPSGVLYGLHHLNETVDVQVSSSPQTFFFECPTGEQIISAAAILYRVDGQEYRAEPPTEIAGVRATFSFVNPYTEPTQLQAGYNCAKVSS